MVETASRIPILRPYFTQCTSQTLSYRSSRPARSYRSYRSYRSARERPSLPSTSTFTVFTYPWKTDPKTKTQEETIPQNTFLTGRPGW